MRQQKASPKNNLPKPGTSFAGFLDNMDFLKKRWEKFVQSRSERRLVEAKINQIEENIESDILFLVSKDPERERRFLYDRLNYRNNKELVHSTLGAVVVTVLTTLGVTFFTQHQQNKFFEVQNRPYVFIDQIDTTHDSEAKISVNKFRLKNTGIIPARIISLDYSCAVVLSPSTAIIGKDQIMISTLSVADSKFPCDLKIKYSKATSEVENEYESNYTINQNTEGVLTNQAAEMK